LWCGHHHWFAQADGTTDVLPKLANEIGSLAALSDQSDSRLIVALSGPAARATLAKLAPIDLHPRAFRDGETAVTLLGHIGGQVTLIDDRPTYELMVSRSYAGSFLHSLLDAAAEFGVAAG
jgi:sarcosine oxidase subunit gamma